MTERFRYVPQLAQAVWGRLAEPQRSHFVSVVGAAFHCERRARVFDRDTLRFGTAILSHSPSYGDR